MHQTTEATGRAVHPRRRRAGRRRTRGAVACAVAGAAAVLALAACGGSAPAPAATSSASADAYATCLLQHLRDNGGQGARRACKPLKPAGGIGPLLIRFTSCLSDHGVKLPVPAPAASQGTASTPPRPLPEVSAVLQFLNTVRTGTPAERSAFSACAATL